MQMIRTSQMKKNRDSKTEIPIHDDPSDKCKGSVHVEEVVHNEPGDSLIDSGQISNRNINNSSNNIVFFCDSILKGIITFWKTVALLFSIKFSRNEKMNLTEENETISTGSELSRVFSNFFTKAVDEFKFQVFKVLRTMKVMTHLKKHSAISRITVLNVKRKSFDERFNFRETNSNEVIKLIKTLNINKVC